MSATARQRTIKNILFRLSVTLVSQRECMKMLPVFTSFSSCRHSLW